MSKDYKLIGFDLDWTIRGTKSGNIFPDNVADWELLPGRLEKITTLREEGKHIAVLTNQGGLLWRVATGQDKYPTPIMLGEALKPIIMQLSPTQQDPWYISLYDQRAVDLINKNIAQEIYAVSDMAGHSADNQAPPIYEEPEDVLKRLQKELSEVLENFNVWISIDPRWRKPEPGMLIVACGSASVSPEETLFVGDRPEDEKAAKAANVGFMWSWQFFGDKEPSNE